MKSGFVNIVKKCEQNSQHISTKQTSRNIPRHMVRYIVDNVSFEEVLLHFNFETKDMGQYLRILCPFHDDTHPSLDANKDQPIFVCRACGESGNTIDFIKKYLSVGFGEALNVLAAIKGITGFEPKDEIIAAVKQYEMEEARSQKNRELRIGGLTLDDFNVKISSICRDHLFNFPEDWDFVEKVYKNLDIWIDEKNRINLKRLDRTLMGMLREHKEKILDNRNQQIEGRVI